MRKLVLTVLMLIQAVSGVHCARNGRGDQRLDTVGRPLGSEPAEAQGTVDGGGGGGIKGKPIESYARNIREFAEYKVVVEPVLVSIGRIHPEYQNVFLHIVKNRNWLFTGEPVANLGAARQGTPFNIDQWAAQNNKEIWFSDQYQGEAANKGRILLHEILVGVKLLKYLSSNEKCTAQFGSSNCDGTNGAALVDDYKLHDLDHQDVRKTVDWLLLNHAGMTGQEFGQKMHEGQFQSDQVSFKKYLANVTGGPAPHFDLRLILEKNIGHGAEGMYTDFDTQHAAHSTCKLMLSWKEKGTLEVKVERLDGKSKKVLGEYKTSVKVPEGSLLRPETRGDGNVRQAALELGEVEVQFSLEDEKPIALTYLKEKLECKSLPVELPHGYEAWIEMRAPDRAMLEKRYFGSTIEELAARLKHKYPDWK